MTPAIHFVRVDLGETTTSASYLHNIQSAMTMHDWSCDYCAERRLA